MNFAGFQASRERTLRENPGLLDCAETNLYRSLAPLQPQPDATRNGNPVHRCDLARAWLARYGFPAELSRRALVCRGVRHALTLIFHGLARDGATLWAPRDVYPVYLELARAAGIQPRLFSTLPAPEFPDAAAGDTAEFLLIANPLKPLGRHLTEDECARLIHWLDASPRRNLLLDCVYDLATPFHVTTQTLFRTGRTVLLHSATKGWLWPKTFGVALIGENHSPMEIPFRDDPPAPAQLRLAELFFSTAADCPARVAGALHSRAQNLFAALPDAARRSLLPDASIHAAGCYLFPVAMPADQLLKDHRLLALPAGVFGADWKGSVLTSLSPAFAPAAANL